MNDAPVVRPGDVVSYAAEDHVVESQATYAAPALSWTEWRLNPGSVERRVTLAAVDGKLFLGGEASIEGAPGAATVTCDGRLLSLARQGKADARVTDATGAARFDRPEFWHYTDDAGGLLIVRRSHGSVQAVRLEPASSANLEVYNA